MRKKQFEMALKKQLIGAKNFKYWSVKTLASSLKHDLICPPKRSLERWIAGIPWLSCSIHLDQQNDEFDRLANKLVLASLVAGARRKRKQTLFTEIHDLPTLGEGRDLGECGERKILVAKDGKGSRRWCLIVDDKVLSILTGLKTLAAGKASVFFPAGSLVSACRKIKSTEGLDDSIEIVICQYPEKISTKTNSLPHKKSISCTQPEKLSNLDILESESIHIMREAVANAENPVMLYSVGKDSSVMLHLAKKAFYPSTPPFPLLHVDTRWKFQAMYDFRDIMAEESQLKLIVYTNPQGIEKNINPFDHGSTLHTNIMKTEGLTQALDLYGFDMAFGGARRDEEKSRAKERVFSFRSTNHRWNPKNQRPELWNLYNCRKSPGESVRVFPLSNWTELDIWQYIYRENLRLVPLYFATERAVVERNGILILVDDERFNLKPKEVIELRRVRFRTLGCYPLTGAVESSATDLSHIIVELMRSRTSEREGRAIDSDSNSSMEKKKQEGYF
tara:strand:+ start:7489 stop:9003 length:1515 start_codon:yes stop_codon:yes gene_type:complete